MENLMCVHIENLRNRLPIQKNMVEPHKFENLIIGTSKSKNIQN